MKIALLCPTRNRINKLMTLISSLICTTKENTNIYLVLGVDEDDPAQKYYSFLENNVPFIKFIKFNNNGKFLGLSTMWNTMAKKIDADIYAMIGDDMVFMSPNWDDNIIKEFTPSNCPADKIKMVHCNDGMRGTGNTYPSIPPLCVNFFIHRNYITTTGYFTEPYMENSHHDTWTQIIFDRLNRTKYRHDILIKHLHYSETDKKMDKVSTNLEEMRKNVVDNFDFVHKLKKEMDDEISKLQHFITRF